MATVSKDILNLDGGLFSVSIDYDDVALNILNINATNSNDRDYYISVTSTATQKQYSFTISPGTLNQPIPQDVVNEIALTVRANGKVDGAEWTAQSQLV